ncbi:MAG: hypothetical protein JOZ57_15795, partial [Abitibacteriaceae bacterium]|nr:hypothetical protein [Abditibacteriaceae bacterium]
MQSMVVAGAGTLRGALAQAQESRSQESPAKDAKIAPRVLRRAPGRIRVHLPAWEGQRPSSINARLRQQPGVRSTRASAATANVLVEFDPAAVNEQQILTALATIQWQVNAVDTTEGDAPERDLPPAVVERRGQQGRARIAMRGLDRDPALSQRAVARLERLPGVARVAANALTGRVLVEFNEHEVELEDLISEVADIELPALPGEDRPTHPLDREPLIQSATRTAGAAAGMGVLATRRLIGTTEPIVETATPVYTSAILGILQGFPATRNTLRHLFGKDAADLLLSVPDIISLSLSGNPLGLAVTGAGALRLLTEVMARRAAWHRYESMLETAPHTYAGGVIRVEAGERIPRAGCVLEGQGAAVGHDGLPVALGPGDRIGAGARCTAGPLVLELEAKAFVPTPRPAPPKPSLYEHYTRQLSPLSLAYVVLTALLTRSASRVFEALLLVNPRTALIGVEFANIGASARVLRAGVIVVGTRPERMVRLPDVLLLDGPRLLSSGLEVCSVLPLIDDADSSDLLALAAGVAAGAGSPWGGVFPAAGRAVASEGDFDGKVATASVKDVTYTLGDNCALFADDERIAKAMRRHQSDYLLVLVNQRDNQPLALFVLRPRLAAGLTNLVQVCRRYGVEVVLVAREESLTAQALARRAKVALCCTHDAVHLIQRHQAQGAVVAMVSDHAHAAAAFAACDLAIGVSSGRSGRFPARVDLLAPDLEAVAIVIETGARRRDAVHGAVALSVANNIGGAIWGWRGGPGVRRASYLMYITSLASMAWSWLRLRGGERSQSAVARLADPRPERWGNQTVDSVLAMVDSTSAGLSSAQAALRQRRRPQIARRNELLTAVLDQL